MINYALIYNGGRMAPKTNRFTIALDDDSTQLLKMMEEFTGFTPAQTIAKTFPAHLEEFWYYLTWLQQLPEGPSRLRSLGCSLLQSYGPNSLVEDIKRIDPEYKAESDKLATSRKTEGK
jgi:hypothetical protein